MMWSSQDPSVFLSPLSTPFNTPASSTCSLDATDKTAHLEIEQLISSSLNRYVSKYSDIQNWLRQSVEEEFQTNCHDSDPSSLVTSAESFCSPEYNDSPSNELKHYINKSLDELECKTYSICPDPKTVDISLKPESVRHGFPSTSGSSSYWAQESVQLDIEECIYNNLNQLIASKNNSHPETVIDINLKSQSVQIGSTTSTNSSQIVEVVQPDIEECFCIGNDLEQLKASDNDINEKSICLHSSGFDISSFLREYEIPDDRPSSDEELEAFINSSFTQLKSRLSEPIEYEPIEITSDQIEIFAEPIIFEMDKINWPDLTDEMKQKISDALRKLEISIDGMVEECKIDITSSVIFNKAVIDREADIGDEIREVSDDEKTRIIENATDQLDKHINEFMVQLDISVHGMPHRYCNGTNCPH